jgi:excisionase family DNA binding protein
VFTLSHSRDRRCTYRSTYRTEKVQKSGRDPLESFRKRDAHAHGDEWSRRGGRRVIHCSRCTTYLERGLWGFALECISSAQVEKGDVSVQSRQLSKLLYSVPEAAELLSCSRSTIYALLKSGELDAVYPTSKLRISAKSLERFVETKTDEYRKARASQRQLLA